MTQITDYDVTGFLVCVMRPYAPVALCTSVIQMGMILPVSSVRMHDAR